MKYTDKELLEIYCKVVPRTWSRPVEKVEGATILSNYWRRVFEQLELLLQIEDKDSRIAFIMGNGFFGCQRASAVAMANKIAGFQVPEEMLTSA